MGGEYQHNIDGQLTCYGNRQHFFITFAAAVVVANTIVFQPTDELGSHGNFIFTIRGSGLFGYLAGHI